jgi:hypothetical protein
MRIRRACALTAGVTMLAGVPGFLDQTWAGERPYRAAPRSRIVMMRRCLCTFWRARVATEAP